MRASIMRLGDAMEMLVAKGVGSRMRCGGRMFFKRRFVLIV